MTLTIHALVGAAVASLVPEYPVLGFVLAFGSHLAIDSLPHYDYEILSQGASPDAPGFRFDRLFLFDLGRIGFDASLGVVLAWLFFSSPAHPYLPVLGAIAGILPDPLQFAYKFFPRALRPLQRFHERIQEGKTIFRYRPIPGFASQAVTLSLFFLAYILLANVVAGIS